MQLTRELLSTTSSYLNILAQQWITDLKGLLSYYPRGHEDREQIYTVEQVRNNPNIKVTLKAQVVEKKYVRLKSRTMWQCKLIDEDGQEAELSYFKTGYVFNAIKEGQWYLIIGKPKITAKKVIFSHPDLVETKDSWLKTEEEFSDSLQSLEYSPLLPDLSEDKQESNKVERLYPIYSELQWISAWWFANKIRSQLDQIPKLFPEFLPEDFMSQFALIDRAGMIRGLHYPDDQAHLEAARYRLYFEKLLTIQLQTQMARRDYQGSAQWQVSWNPDREIVKDISQNLPFTLTDPQKKCIKQIIDDFYTGKPMMRLMQWDVGSGKTVVAVTACYYLVKQLKQQAIIMAPLEVLAQQHYLSISKLLLPLWIRVWLLVGSLTQWQKDKMKLMMRAGHIDIVIGTHALVQDDIEFHNLWLAVIDEQHKFGVMQRGFFHRFDKPHILQMTATPIPRSLALAAFAEFDVSIIDQLPGGRKPIITKVATASNTRKIQPRIADKLDQGQNMFVVVPLIEESENLEWVDNAFAVYEQMQQLYPNHKVGLMHGKMKPKDKDDVMSDFKSSKLQILVSTTVIEVGVDVPHATIMIIKSAQRFGLAQLHQLRWRVGRSDLQSYCFLETDRKDVERLQAMEETTDGFRLAELDMKLRGTGELLWTRQSGIADIPLEMIGDLSWVETVWDAARWLLDHYPDLLWLEVLQKNLHIAKEELLS